DNVLRPQADQKTCCIEQVDLHDGDDRIHRQLAQPVEGSAHLVLRGKSYGQQRDGISLVRRGRGDRLQGSYVARGREGEQDDTEGAELTSFQGARGAVGSITQI